MKISELFYSVQGEGILSGVPSVFIRTTGCNLRCTWCDTPYTSWDPQGVEMLLEEIVAEIGRFGAEHVVVTGGEPMIAPEIVKLTEALKAIGRHITIETAGTVFQPVVCDLMSISPKLSNSTPTEREGGLWAAQHDRLRIQPAVLLDLMRNYTYQLKFVVSTPEDLVEIKALVGELRPQKSRVLLMPEGTDVDTLRARARWVAEICKAEGYRFCARLHIELYGNRRGT